MSLCSRNQPRKTVDAFKVFYFWGNGSSPNAKWSLFRLFSQNYLSNLMSASFIPWLTSVLLKKNVILIFILANWNTTIYWEFLKHSKYILIQNVLHWSAKIYIVYKKLRKWYNGEPFWTLDFTFWTAFTLVFAARKLLINNKNKNLPSRLRHCMMRSLNWEIQCEKFNPFRPWW